MGVFPRIQEPFSPEGNNNEADVVESFDLAEQDNESVEDESQQADNRKKSKKCRTVHPGDGLPERRPRGTKKRRRYEQLMNLLEHADPDDLEEVTIYDFYPPKMSAFAQLLLEKHYMKAWNEFIASSELDQEELVLGGGGGSKKREGKRGKRRGRLNSSGCDAEERDSSWEELQYPPSAEDHPAFTPEECFKKIDSKLRHMLRKRHLPMGLLSHLESEVVSFFSTYTDHVYMHQLRSSFDRMLLHAVAQYLDLTSHSCDGDVGSASEASGTRFTYVENKREHFQPPSLLLSKYLQILRSNSN